MLMVQTSKSNMIKFQFFTNLIIWLGMTAFVFYDQIFKLLAKLKIFLLPCGLLFSSTLDANHGRNGYTILATWTPNSFFGFFIVLQALFAITVEVVLFPKCRFSYISEVWKVIFLSFCDVVKNVVSNLMSVRWWSF